MKKIGIMTFHRSHNCGSMLQALALQNVLAQRYGLPVELIDFSNKAQQNMYAILPKADNLRRFVKKMIFASNYGQIKKQYDAYNGFIENYFHLSEQFFETEETLQACEEQYQAVIAGSDQIWNIRCLDADNAYYLGWINKIPKYAYAVSFGANNPFVNTQLSACYAPMVKDFAYVSVREKNAQKWIGEALDINVPLCVDPTMLFDREQWERMVQIGDKPVISGDYIFYYCFSLNERVQKFLKQVSKKYKMPVYILDAKEWTLKTCWRNGIRLVKEYGPDVYLNMVKNAKIFITASFHGTAFATIFEKCFWYLDDGGNDASKDDRAITFLTQLDLMDRYKTPQQMLQMNLTQGRDYSETKLKQQMLRERSLAYLDMIVKDFQNEQ